MDSDDDFMSNLSSEDDMIQEDDSDNDISNPEGKRLPSYPTCRPLDMLPHTDPRARQILTLTMSPIWTPEIRTLSKP